MDILHKRLLLVILIVGILIVSSTVIIFYNESLSKRGEGTLSGTVTIGPVFPVCRENATITSVTSPWSSNQVVILPESGNATHIPIPWTLSQGCEISGSFYVRLTAGTYRVDLTSCTSESTRTFGCAALPKTVSISSNTTTHIDISVDTGIR